MATDLSAETIARLKARAADPAKRTDAAALAAGSVGATNVLAEQRESLASRSPEFQRQVQEYLGGMNSPLAGMVSNSVTGDGSQAAGLLGALEGLLGGKSMFAGMGGQTVSFGANSDPSAAPAPADVNMIAWAEGKLGFALPAELRAFYTEVGNGGVGPGDGLYSLAEIVHKYGKLTREPAGPQGQDWPANLLPIQGEDYELVSIDHESGKLVFWDMEELDDDEDVPADNPTWAKSFKTEAESLDAWLKRWAAS